MGIHSPIIILGGPTASGKSHLATVIAKKRNGVIINADALQLYRDIPILSAQPAPKERQAVPHVLYGILPATEHNSVALWLKRAVLAIEQAWAEQKTPIVTGGTGLYFHALMRGLSPIPDIPPAIRQQIEALYQEKGKEGLRAALEKQDPRMAARLTPGDTQRMKRALEVVTHTGVSLAAWQAEPPRPPFPASVFQAFVLDPPRERLYARCNARFLAMMEQGALDEVKSLQGLPPSLPIMKAIGIAELSRYLRGEMTLPEAICLAQRQTRRYAKRQLTWFRHQLPEAVRLCHVENMEGTG